MRDGERLGARAIACAAVAWVSFGLAGAAEIPAASAAAAAPTICTWGGTPTAPTGTFSITPGLTNTASAAPAAFEVDGRLAGGPGCSGEFAYDGQIDTGGTCAANTFQGRASGIPGVTRFAGSGVGVLAVARLYGDDGSLIGSAISQLATADNAPHLGDCGTPEGFTGGSFSSVVTFLAASQPPSGDARKCSHRHRHRHKHKRCHRR